MGRFRSLVLYMSAPSVMGFFDIKKPIIRGPTAPLENLKLFDQYIFAKNVQLAMENNKSKIESKQKLDTLSKMASTQSTSDDDDNDDD